eukprot:3712057-Pyramimonas_sp.AAC.1
MQTVSTPITRDLPTTAPWTASPGLIAYQAEESSSRHFKFSSAVRAAVFFQCVCEQFFIETCSPILCSSHRNGCSA